MWSMFVSRSGPILASAEGPAPAKWLDVSTDPARGKEPADLIERRRLKKIVGGASWVDESIALARLIDALRPGG